MKKKDVHVYVTAFLIMMLCIGPAQPYIAIAEEGGTSTAAVIEAPPPPQEPPTPEIPLAPDTPPTPDAPPDPGIPTYAPTAEETTNIVSPEIQPTEQVASDTNTSTEQESEIKSEPPQEQAPSDGTVTPTEGVPDVSETQSQGEGGADVQDAVMQQNGSTESSGASPETPESPESRTTTHELPFVPETPVAPPTPTPPPTPIAPPPPPTPELAQTEIPRIETDTDGSESRIEHIGDPTVSLPDQPGLPSIIATGDANAFANVVNVANSNFVNSSGVISFGNFTDDTETIDARESTLFQSATCTVILPCTAGSDVTVRTTDNATIDNDIALVGSSGRNAIAGAGIGTIATGDAAAGLNLVNMANVNMIDASYYVLMINAFKNVHGDIIFPSLSQFWNILRGTSPTSYTSKNTATIENNISNNATAGDNTVVDVNNGIIASGQSKSFTNILNAVNTDTTNDNILILFKIKGTWSGDVLGVPDGIYWERTSDGIQFSSAPPQNTALAREGTLDVATENTAVIRNHLSVDAVSGENILEDVAHGIITTGMAHAAANVINIANTTVVGKRWLLAVVNIFGDFTGNVAFGRPDLRVAITDTGPLRVQNDAPITFTVSVRNTGDARATDTRLTLIPDEHITIRSITTLPTHSFVWDLGTLTEGQSHEFIVDAFVHDAPPGTPVRIKATAEAHEPDNAPDDNTFQLELASASIPPGTSYSTPPTQPFTDARVTPSEVAQELPDPAPIKLWIVRSHRDMTITPQERSVHHRLIVGNDTSQRARNVSIHDLLYAPDGTVVHDEPWNIGDIEPGEELQLEYDASFGNDAPSGIYTCTTVVSGDNVPEYAYARNGVLTIQEPQHVATIPQPKKHARVYTTMKKVHEPIPLTQPIVPNVVVSVIEPSQTTQANTPTEHRKRTPVPYQYVLGLLVSAQYIGRKIIQYAWMMS